LDKIELPADQLPPEVQKPGGMASAVEQAAEKQDTGNMLAMGQNFEQLAGSMRDFSHTVGELKKSGEWNASLEMMNLREKSLQEKYKVDVQERKLQIEQLKAQAMKEETKRMQDKIQKEHELAMKKAQYEDQLRQKRKEYDLQKEVEAQKRIEEAKRETIVFQQEQEMKNEEKKAMIHARAQAQVERENHDIRMEQTRAQAKEKMKGEVMVSEMQTKMRWENLKKLAKNEDGMLKNTALFGGGLLLTGIIGWKITGEVMRQVAARTTRPNLIQETSRWTWNNWTPLYNKLGMGKKVKPPQYIFSRGVQEKVEDITLVTRNVVKNNTNHRNVLLFGPPGTGKTLYAKSLATDSNMEYAIMSGGDVAPLGSQATYELNKMFDWAHSNRKGMVLFIDEAEAFLRPREENMSTELRSVINTFLARTGEPSKKIQIVLATNQVNQLDSAVLDRMNELLEIPLPGFNERQLMLKQYLLSHVIMPTQKKDQRVTLDPDIIPNFENICEKLAETTEGMSGRELEKMCGNIYASAVSKEEAAIDLNVLEKAAIEYRSQSDKKLEIRLSREKKV